MTPGVIVMRVNADENTVQYYFNQKKQVEHKIKEFQIKDMKKIRAWAGVRQEQIVEFV